jgi:ABC-2 type transport system ATP-binding protein
MEKEEEYVIELKDLSKFYGNIPALKNVSLKIKKNTIFGLLGSNGAGKTTLLHILSGLLDYDGDVNILGRNIKRYPKILKKKLSIMPQKISLYNDLSIYDNLYYFGKSYGLKRKEVIEKISGFKKELLLGDLNRKIKYLSGGYQRRVSLAVTLIGDPEIIILDEAMVGIDLETKKIIIELLKKLKKEKTIITTTHSIPEAELLCDYVVFLHRGEKVLEGGTKKIIDEYSIDHNITLYVKYKDRESPGIIAEKFNRMKINAKVKKEMLKIDFSPKKYNIFKILDYIRKNQKYQDSIKDIEIKKPGLEEIMLDCISSKD